METNEPRRTSTPRPVLRLGDMASRIIFGGFWSLIALGALISSIAKFSAGHLGSGMGSLVVAVLTALYARYLFRGGRIRILFW